MIGPVLDAVASAAARIAWRSDACVRNNPVIAVREDCRVCESACPAGAIWLDQLQVLTPPCDGCQLCLPLCPTAALVERPSVRRDLLTAWRGVPSGKPFAVACGLAESPEHARTLEIGCLASLRWEAMVIPLLPGASSVELRRGHCAECRFGARLGDTLEGTVGFAQRCSLGFGLRLALLEAGLFGREADDLYDRLRRVAGTLGIPYLTLFVPYRDFVQVGDISGGDLEELDAWKAQVAGGR